MKPVDRAAWRNELERVESYGVQGITYLLGDFAQSLWDRVPAFADAYALVQGEAYEGEQRRIAAAQREPEDDPTRILGDFGRP